MKMPKSQHTEMWNTLIAEMREVGIAFESGLSDTEITSIEGRFHFRFPPDLRAFLQTAQPVGEPFPNWRSEDDKPLQDWLDRPCQGILFDIENNGFWLEEWGPRPAFLEDAREKARELITTAPSLIPIYNHRMMPTDPHLSGNPVFSIHQTDIIYYGIDLRDYLIHEFLTREDVGTWPIPDDMRQIEFWDIKRFQDVR